MNSHESAERLVSAQNRIARWREKASEIAGNLPNECKNIYDENESKYISFLFETALATNQNVSNGSVISNQIKETYESFNDIHLPIQAVAFKKEVIAAPLSSESIPVYYVARIIMGELALKEEEEGRWSAEYQTGTLPFIIDYQDIDSDTVELNNRMLILAFEPMDNPERSRATFTALSDCYYQKKDYRKFSHCFFESVRICNDVGVKDDFYQSQSERMEAVMEEGRNDKAHEAWMKGLSIIQEEGYSISARQYFETVLAKYPYSADIQHTYGMLIAELESLALGIKHLEAALSINPLDPECYLDLVEMYIDCSAYERARTVLFQAKCFLDKRVVFFSTGKDEEELRQDYTRLFRMVSSETNEWTRREIVQSALRNFYSLARGMVGGLYSLLGCDNYQNPDGSFSSNVMGWPLFYFDDGSENAHYFVMTQNREVGLIREGKKGLDEIVESPFGQTQIFTVGSIFGSDTADMLIEDVISNTAHYEIQGFRDFVEDIFFKNAINCIFVNLVGTAEIGSTKKEAPSIEDMPIDELIKTVTAEQWVALNKECEEIAKKYFHSEPWLIGWGSSSIWAAHNETPEALQIARNIDYQYDRSNIEDLQNTLQFYIEHVQENTRTMAILADYVMKYRF